MYGVSETRIVTLLRNAYCQNYVYLIKKPEDQYQVILEAEDAARAHPEDLSRLYIRSDDGKQPRPADGARRPGRPTLGPQAVNHLNQFTSVTFYFNLMPGVPIGDATDFIRRRPRQIVPPTLRARVPGRGPHLPEHGPQT